MLDRLDREIIQKYIANLYNTCTAKGLRALGYHILALRADKPCPGRDTCAIQLPIRHDDIEWLDEAIELALACHTDEIYLVGGYVVHPGEEEYEVILRDVVVLEVLPVIRGIAGD